MELGKREVTAPVADWLTEDEVLRLLGKIDSTTLRRWIRRGRFPQGVPWGRDRRWRWVDVAWFLLGQEIADRLRRPPDTVGPDDDTPIPPDKPPGERKERKRDGGQHPP